MSTRSILEDGIRSAKAQINRMNAQISESQANNRRLDAKIQQLKEAKQHAEWAGSNADTLKQCVYQVQPGDWAGTNWDAFRDTTHGGEAYTRAKELHRSCDDLRDAIQAEINAAYARKDYFAELIGGAQWLIQSSYNSIKSLTVQLARLD